MVAVDYKHKTKPYDHQQEVFLLSRDKEYFALLMEQGTGKTKVALDTAAWLYINGRIDGVLIIAPNGVHTNWIKTEIPIHLPDYVDATCWTWKSSAVATLHHKTGLGNLLNCEGLAILAINVEGIRTKPSTKFLKSFLNARRCLSIVDESTTIKNPGAKRTKRAWAIKDYSPYRRILTGTPVTRGPLDLYSQFKFLADGLLGFETFSVFKHHYGFWKQMENTAKGYRFEICTGYKNLDQLKAHVDTHSYRKTKKECLDLPEQIYMRRTFAMTKEQTKYYKTMRDEYYIEIENQLVTAAIILTRYLRLQQICNGFYPVPDNEGEPTGAVTYFNKVNPRITALGEVLDQVAGKCIIWARFNPDVDAVCAYLDTMGGMDFRADPKMYPNRQFIYVVYDGRVKIDDREVAKVRFQEDDEVTVFVGKASAGGRGLTLHAATDVIYYSNSFSYEERKQSEDRAHRIGQHHPVTYTDIQAEDTIDHTILTALREKKNLSDLVTGDKRMVWI